MRRLRLLLAAVAFGCDDGTRVSWEAGSSDAWSANPPDASPEAPELPPPGNAWPLVIGGPECESLADIAAASSGEFVVTGWYDGRVNFGAGVTASHGWEDGYVAGYRTEPTPTWSSVYGSAAGDSGVATAIDSEGNVVLAGTFRGTITLGGTMLESPTGFSGFVAKFDATGALLWVTPIVGSGEGTLSRSGLAIDDDDAVLLSGSFSSEIMIGSAGTFTGDYYLTDGFVAKIHGLTGTPHWVRRLFLPSPAFATAIEAGSNPRIWVGGEHSEPPDSSDAFHAFLEPEAGTLLSLETIGGIGRQYVTDGDVSPDGSVLVVGEFEVEAVLGSKDAVLTSAGGTDVFLARYDDAGVPLWARRIGGAGHEHAAAAIELATGTAALVGAFDDEAEVGPFVAASRGQSDGYVAILALADGEPLRFATVGGPGMDALLAAATAGGHAYIAGSFQDSITVGGHELASAGCEDVVVFRLDDLLTP